VSDGIVDTLHIRLVQMHEALRLRMYKCTANYWTIGWGHNLEARGISRAVADAILNEDLAVAERDLDAIAPWWRTLDPVRGAALLDMCFNLGRERFEKFGPTLEVIRLGDYVQAAARLQRTPWFVQTKSRAQRIVGMIATGRVPADVPEDVR
jgi:lysozyme